MLLGSIGLFNPTRLRVLFRERSGVMVHHVFPRYGWISFWIKDGDNVLRATDLIRMACAYRKDAK